MLQSTCFGTQIETRASKDDSGSQGQCREQRRGVRVKMTLTVEYSEKTAKNVEHFKNNRHDKGALSHTRTYTGRVLKQRKKILSVWVRIRKMVTASSSLNSSFHNSIMVHTPMPTHRQQLFTDRQFGNALAIHRSQDSLAPFWTGIVVGSGSVTGMRLYGFSVFDELSPGTVGLFFIRFAQVKNRLKGISFT